MHIIDMLHLLGELGPIVLPLSRPRWSRPFRGWPTRSNSIGERIDRLNLNKREPVAVCIANPSFMLAAIFALLRSGYSAAPVNARLYPHLAGAGLRNLIYDTEGQVASGGRNIRFDMSWLPRPQQTATMRTYRKSSDESPDMIFFTSGTTGLPKKVVKSAAALEQRLRYSAYVSDADQKVLFMPGLTSAHGLDGVCEVLSLGRTACFAPDSMSALSLINLFGIEAVVASVVQALSSRRSRRIRIPGIEFIHSRRFPSAARQSSRKE